MLEKSTDPTCLVVADFGKLMGHRGAYLLDAGGDDFVRPQALTVALEELVAVVTLVAGFAREVSHHERIRELDQSSAPGDGVVK